jgi:rhamnosyl/mannosyltransferase
MRILQVYKDYPPVIGGIERHVKSLAEGESGRGLDVTVLTTNTGPRTVVERSERLTVIRAGRLCRLASTPISISFFRWLSRLPADITHLHFPYPPGEVGHLAAGKGRKLVITYHSDIVRQRRALRLYGATLRRVLKRADRIIATSRAYVGSSAFLSEYAEKCEVIPLGIDLSWMDRADRARIEAVRSCHRSPLALFVGRLRYYKGLQYLLEAYTRIPGTLLVIGSGPMRREWERLAAGCGLGGRVLFLGDVPDASLPAYYQACDVFVLPASHRSEAFGLVQVEAMAAGRPVVSTDLGTGTSFVNVHQETGLVVEPRDPDALAQAINRLLSDEPLRRKLGAAGRQRVEREFAADIMIDRTIGLYERVLKTGIL